MELLDEISEIPFEVFWGKYKEKKPGRYNRLKAQKEWFYMTESQRISAFESLDRVYLCNEPWEYLSYFRNEF